MNNLRRISLINKFLSTSYKSVGQLLKTIEEPLFLGYLTEAQATKLFQQQGFSIINVYKWWDFSPVDEELKELIFVLQKK